MEKKTAAILAVALLAAVVATAGGAYALDRQSPTSQGSAYGYGMGQGMMGGQGGHLGSGMGGGYMHPFAHNYSHLYQWDYCNSSSS